MIPKWCVSFCRDWNLIKCVSMIKYAIFLLHGLQYANMAYIGTPQYWMIALNWNERCRTDTYVQQPFSNLGVVSILWLLGYVHCPFNHSYPQIWYFVTVKGEDCHASKTCDSKKNLVCNGKKCVCSVDAQEYVNNGQLDKCFKSK